MSFYKALPPMSITVGTSSVTLLSLKTQRQFVIISNLDTVNEIFLAFNGNAAVVNKGVMIPPKGTMPLPYEQISLDRINIIASGENTLVSFQEFV